jgi:hypothetical protein
MTIFNLARAGDASFKGATFSVQDSTIEGGRKKITHEYPGKKSRYIEDLGGLEKKFRVNVWTNNNVNYNERDSLIEALETTGSATLYLPDFSFENVTSTTYTVSWSNKELGISKFSINFEEGSDNILPIPALGNKGFVANLKTALLGDNETAFNNAVKSVKNNKAKFDSFNATVKATARKIDKVSQNVQGAADTFSDFTTSINQIIAASASLVQSPEVLSEKINIALDNLSVAYESSKDVFTVFKGLFGLDERDQSAEGTSSQQQDINTNQNQVANIVNAGALGIAYDAAAKIDYQTLDELNQVETDLEIGFGLLPNTLDDDILDSLRTIRVEASKIFSDLSISLPNVIDFEIPNPISLNVLVYNIYGSLDLKNTIRDLNQFRDTSQVSGTIKILSNV